jgi:hypothetical protein
MITLILARLRWLLSETGRSDGDARPTPYAAAATSMAHLAIGMWTALGFLSMGAPWWAAIGYTIALWGGVWEARQYLAAPTVRTRRDWLLADAPSYAIGAVAAAELIGDAVAGRWVEWLALTPVVVLWPGIVGAAFGRVPQEDKK